LISRVLTGEPNMNMLYEYLNRRALKTAADPITLDDSALSVLDESRKALAEKDAQRRALFSSDSQTYQKNLEELTKQLPVAPDLPPRSMSITVPYGRVIDAVDKAQRHADATRAPAPTKDEIAEARKRTPRGRMDEYLRRMAARQSENDLAKMDDRSEEATAATDNYVRRMAARQSENDLAKMDARRWDAAAADEYVRRMAARRRTMAVAGGAAALGSAALIYFLMRKRRRKNKPAAPRKALA
jgi:hypothetical protein